MKKKKKKNFDCIAMKRQIQEKIYAETKGMSRDELVEYMNRSVEEGPFSALFAKAKKSKVS